MRKTGKKRSRIWSAVGILCFLFAAVMIGMVGRTLISYWNSEKSMEQMYRDMTEPAAGQAESPADTAGSVGSKTVEAEAGSQPEAETAESEPGWKSTYAALQRRNSDMIGWIQIPGTVIDYPVMHTPDDSNYYFHRDFYGEYSSYGMIYMDGACRLDGSSPNLLIYGHHMRNGTMFASIEKYRSAEYWKQHPQIYFSTPEEDGVYEVMAVFRISADAAGEEFMAMLAAGTEEDYQELIQYMDNNSLYQTEVTAQWPDSLITLTTCEYTRKDGRFLVVAKKK